MNIEVEIILVEDCGPDNSWDKIVELSKKDKKIKGLKLSRNFGQHYAITAGIDHAKGDLVGVVDCDLEDHPRYFRQLLETMLEGNHNIVFARRLNKKHSLFKRITSKLYVKMFNTLTEFKHNSAVGTFSLIDRKAANAFRQYRESLRGYNLIIYQMGFNVGYCDIQHGQRHEGTSTYSLRKLLALTLHTTLVSTEKPLRFISILGVVVSIFAFLFILYIVVLHFNNENPLLGWASTIASIYLIGGITILSIGVNGLYLGKCFRESLKRPLYHIQDET